MINFTTLESIFVVGILWAFILDGLIVERGQNYVKIRLINHEFQKPLKTFFFYLLEIIFITAIVSGFSKNIIPSLLANNPILTIGVSFLGGYAKFRKDVYGKIL